MFSSYSKQVFAATALAGALLIFSTAADLSGTAAKGKLKSDPVKVAYGSMAEFVHESLECSLLNEPVVDTQSTVLAVQTEDEQNSKGAAEEKAVVASMPTKVASAPAQMVSRGDSTGSTIVNKALELQGIPYVFGGMSLNGFDCSGLTKYVYGAAGIDIPRSSYLQFASGTSVSKDQLQPGDLVFFTTYDSGASHVGIYIGGGEFVHASSSGVRTTALSDSYYAGRYLGARRY